MVNDFSSFKGFEHAVIPLILVFGACFIFLVIGVLSDTPCPSEGNTARPCSSEEAGEIDHTESQTTQTEGIAAQPPVRLFMLPKPGEQAADGTVAEIDSETLVALRDQLRDIADLLVAPIEVASQRGDADEKVLKHISELLDVISQRIPPPVEAQLPAGSEDREDTGP